MDLTFCAGGAKLPGCGIRNEADHASGAGLTPMLFFPAGFQTHTTPVLLNAGERAELGTEQYLALSSTLEGVVILKPNPAWIEPDSK